MKKNLIKLAVCILVFFVTLFISVNVYNQRNTDMTAEMSKAQLPLVHMETGGIAFNTLHGLKQNIDGVFLRDTLTPLEDGRKLTFVVEKYGNTINNILFEVRSIDGTRLVESTQVTRFSEDDDEIRATVTIKDLIDPAVEYNWILKLMVGDREIQYCTRIMDVTDYYTDEKLAFVKSFHEKTFDKETVKELSDYMESNSKGDNTTLNHVDIHCNLSQLSWGDLSVKQVTDTDFVINEIDESTASIYADFLVQTTENDKDILYKVREYYRIRYSKDRIYLLDYERDMNQIFDPTANVYASNKIMLGIRNPQVQMAESDGGSNLAFVNEGQLFCYHAADKKMAYIFSFYDDRDIRTYYAHHDIKILNVDETGNVSFMVYGYMNRGIHEGEIGIQVYEYNGMLNHIEEQIFIPYNKTYATLKADIEKLSYVNKSDILYLYLDGYILAVDLLEKSYTEIASMLQEGSFQVSDSDEMLVWQNTEEIYDCNKLILMNLNTGKQTEITTTANNCIMPLGFINDDLIYGVAHVSDIMTDVSGVMTFPMYVVYIQNEQGDILKSYEQTGVYVTGSSVEDNLITLERVVKNESGDGYTPTTSDQIVNNIMPEEGQNTVETVVTQNYEKIVQIVLKSEIQSKSLKITNPKEILYEGDKYLVLDLENSISRYYCYGQEGIDATFTQPSDAINLASENNGTVIDENGKYIWKKTTRRTRNQIMKITGRAADAETKDLAVCLETIMDYYGYSVPVQKFLDEGETATQILETYLPDYKVLELENASLDAMLYYVNLDIPVIVSLGDERAVLLIGYNEVSVVLMNPQNGTVSKMGMNDAAELFEANGNQFMTCIPYYDS